MESEKSYDEEVLGIYGKPLVTCIVSQRPDGVWQASTVVLNNGSTEQAAITMLRDDVSRVFENEHFDMLPVRVPYTVQKEWLDNWGDSSE